MEGTRLSAKTQRFTGLVTNARVFSNFGIRLIYRPLIINKQQYVYCTVSTDRDDEIKKNLVDAQAARTPLRKFD